MTTQPVAVTVVIGTGCPHCHHLLQQLTGLLETGEIATLEALHAPSHPRQVADWGIRAVPWTRIGPFELEGALSPGELRQWVARVDEEKGMAAYFDHLFSRGQRTRVEEWVRRQPDLLQAFVHLLADPQVGLNTRLGVGVVLEEVADTGIASRMVHGLGAISRMADPRLRGDACHYLPLTRSPAAIPYLQACLADDHAEVREIARESLSMLEEGLMARHMVDGCNPGPEGSSSPGHSKEQERAEP